MAEQLTSGVAEYSSALGDVCYIIMSGYLIIEFFRAAND